MDKKYCVMFAGQSVQETGMCRELWELPAARDVLKRLKPSLGEDLEYITTGMPESELALTFNAQRAIHAHHLGHWFAYKAAHPGLALDGAVGHSMGVVAALVAAGCLSVEDSGVFIRARAQAFSDVCRSFTVPMGLAAISTEVLDDAVGELKAFSGVELALHNTVGRGVLGGTLANLQAFAAKAEQEGWPVKIRILKVEGPYHTSAFTSCKESLKLALDRVELRSPRVSLFMGTSGRRERDPQRIKELLVEQADSCEKHLAAVRSAYEAGCRNFLEVAHKPQPLTWIKDQLQDEKGELLPGISTLAVKTAEIGR
ncbi:MAG: ACP S-malonyltransferase [Elusimicrobia bacterium]|nr:ACP S-malonyltransferase [Elusimicrobiota bacterium]